MSPTFKTPANAAVTVGVLAALPILVIGPFSALSLSLLATGLIYVSYFMCNAGVMRARMNGWPHTRSCSASGSWGKVINVLALVDGGFMIVNVALWNDTGLFGDFGTEGRGFWEPDGSNVFIKPFGNELSWMPAWPLFETAVGMLLLAFGALYYLLVAVRRERQDVEVDPAAAEAVIGWHREFREDAMRRGERSSRRLCLARIGWRLTGRQVSDDLHVELIAAMQHVPELAGRALTLTALSAGSRIATSSYDPGDDGPVRHPPRRQRHPPPGHQPRGGARGHRRGRRRRRRAEVMAFLRPEGILVTRFIEGTPMADAAVHAPEIMARVADSVRRSTTGRRSRGCSCRSGS